MNNGTERKKFGTGKACAIGCAALAVVGVVGAILAYQGIKRGLSGLVNAYTDTQPRTLSQVNVPESQARAVCARADRFQQAVKEGKPAEPLVLTGRDINILIQHHPAWKELAGKVYVAVEGSRIRGEVSVPLDQIGGIVKGRYLNGSAVLSVQLVDGRLMVFLDSVEVKGKVPPQAFMQGLKAENLAKDVNTDEKSAEVISRLESITVANGQLRIVAKKPQ